MHPINQDLLLTLGFMIIHFKKRMIVYCRSMIIPRYATIHFCCGYQDPGDRA